MDEDEDEFYITNEQMIRIEKGIGLDGLVDGVRENFRFFTEDYLEERELFEPRVMSDITRIEIAYYNGDLQKARKITQSCLKKWNRFYLGKTYKNKRFDKQYGIYAIHLYSSILRYIQGEKDFKKSLDGKIKGLP